MSADVHPFGGVPKAAASVAAVVVFDGVEIPAAFVAETRNVYNVAGTSPVT